MRRRNQDKVHGISFRNGSTDPKPKSDKDNHGTKVAGLIAAVKDNGLCIPGVAYNSTVIGVQLLDSKDEVKHVTDSDMASAFTHYISDVYIYSNSWGPPDGFGFHGPGILAKKALQEGVTSGRYGKGAIYVFSAGNGGKNDNCNADGYANSIYTIAITSVRGGNSSFPLKSSVYSEVCSPALAATYGGSSFVHKHLHGKKVDETRHSDHMYPLQNGIIIVPWDFFGPMGKQISHGTTIIRWDQNNPMRFYQNPMGFYQNGVGFYKNAMR
ncbi:furin-like protease kpc-1 [Mytilus edulis]|uniref:furin-like protease kpc-1 n=1 Tax=Mytilus edulis TaxID=6550 RepID=UPI0039EF778B